MLQGIRGCYGCTDPVLLIWVPILKQFVVSLTTGPDPVSLICSVALLPSFFCSLKWALRVYFLQNALKPCWTNHHNSTSEHLASIKNTSFCRHKFWNMSLIRVWPNALTSLVFAHVSKSGSDSPVNVGGFCVYFCLCACTCTQTSLPTQAAPLLQKPISSMLVMRGFIREKEVW